MLYRHTEVECVQGDGRACILPRSTRLNVSAGVSVLRMPQKGKFGCDVTALPEMSDTGDLLGRVSLSFVVRITLAGLLWNIGMKVRRLIRGVPSGVPSVRQTCT